MGGLITEKMRQERRRVKALCPGRCSAASRNFWRGFGGVWHQQTPMKEEHRGFLSLERNGRRILQLSKEMRSAFLLSRQPLGFSAQCKSWKYQLPINSTSIVRINSGFYRCYSRAWTRDRLLTPIQPLTADFQGNQPEGAWNTCWERG